MTKLFGDVPEEHKKRELDLEEMERYFGSNPNVSNLLKAKAYVCLAHDWYQMGEENEGSRLLEMAESTYPGYFKTKMFEHTAESEDFDRLVKNMLSELVFMLISRIDSEARK